MVEKLKQENATLTAAQAKLREQDVQTEEQIQLLRKERQSIDRLLESARGFLSKAEGHAEFCKDRGGKRRSRDGTPREHGSNELVRSLTSINEVQECVEKLREENASLKQELAAFQGETSSERTEDSRGLSFLRRFSPRSTPQGRDVRNSVDDPFQALQETLDKIHSGARIPSTDVSRNGTSPSTPTSTPRSNVPSEVQPTLPLARDGGQHKSPTRVETTSKRLAKSPPGTPESRSPKALEGRAAAKTKVTPPALELN